MSHYWSGFVKNLEPYIPGEQPQIGHIIKLNTNENPYGPSPASLEAIRKLLNEDLRLYPAPNADDLKQSLADYYRLSKQQIFVGNGSDEVLAHVFNSLFRHQGKGPLLFPDISYSFYPVFCGLYDIAFETIPLSEDLSIDLRDYRRPNSGIIFANPNAPTGRLVELSSIESLLTHNRDSVVVVDEAYIDFGGRTATSLIDKYDNLLIVQTMSKSRSLAGMRIGFAMGSSALIEGLERVKNSFNSYPLGHLQIAAATASLRDVEYFQKTCQQVITHREYLTVQLDKQGFDVLPSQANFVFTRHPQKDSTALNQALRNRGIIVRHFNKPRIDQFLRITVGTEVQNKLLLEALDEI